MSVITSLEVRAPHPGATVPRSSRICSGIVGLFTTFWARHAPGFWWSLLSAALGIGAGLVLLAWPVGGAVSLTLVLIVFFLIEGIASIMYALEHRQQLSGRWGWMLASGTVRQQ